MGLKTAFLSVILIAFVIALFNGAPQKGIQWLRSTEFGGKWLNDGGEQSLPGPLRGLIDPSANSNLSVTGVVEFTNAQREQNGLVALHVNSELSKAAEAKVDDMFAKQYFEHESPDGKAPADIISAAGYEYIVVGENLALGNFLNDEVLVQAWMDSPGHRANILNDKYLEIGVAVRKGEFEGKTVWLAVQEFGSPLSSCPAPKGTLKTRIDYNRTTLANLQSDLQAMKPHLKTDEDVDRYNALVGRINNVAEETKRLVADYNDQVNAFNDCLETNT